MSAQSPLDAAPVARARPARRRLDHVDVMRPVKQAGVVSTHSIIFFAPPWALAAGGALTLLHVTREAFLFISACMLTYGYGSLQRSGWGRYYRRRAAAVVVPYVCWTAIYFVVTLPRVHVGSVGGGAGHFGYLLASGYYQLYYLLVIMQYYLVFPAALWLLRKLSAHHGALLAASLAVQVALTAAVHWNLLPGVLEGFWGTREVFNYQFYLVAGMVAALHLDEMHDWLWRHRWGVLGATCVAAVAVEAWYAPARLHWVGWLGSATDAFQPVVIPFNVGAIACLYILGIWLVSPGRPPWLRAMARSGSDNAYGIYLSQMLFVLLLSTLGVQSLDAAVPWPPVTVGAVATVLAGSVLLSSVLARTPLAVPLTGRQRERWSTWLPRRWRAEPPEVAAPESALVGRPAGLQVPRSPLGARARVPAAQLEGEAAARTAWAIRR